MNFFKISIFLLFIVFELNYLICQEDTTTVQPPDSSTTNTATNTATTSKSSTQDGKEFNRTWVIEHIIKYVQDNPNFIYFKEKGRPFVLYEIDDNPDIDDDTD